VAGDKLVPLVVSAVVSVGFVAFAGKAVLWTRFSALQVPADQVVKAVPQSEAVAVGASMLLIFGFFGALAALGVYLLDRGGRATVGMSRGLLVILAVEAAVAIWFTEGKPLPSVIVATEVLVLAAGAIFWATFVAGLTREVEVPDLEGDEEPQDVERGPFYRGKNNSGISPREKVLVPLAAAALGLAGYLVATVVGAESGWAWVVALAVVGAALVAAVLLQCHRFAREEKEKEEAKTPPGDGAEATNEVAPQPPVEPVGDADIGDGEDVQLKPPGVGLAPWGVAFTLAFTAAIVAIPSLVLHEWWLAIALGSVAILGSALWKIASLDERRFVWYGLAVFISVPLFGTLMLMARNIDEPQVQPMALIRSTDGPDEAIQGLYVTETSDRVYFANVATEGCEEKVTPHSGRLLWVPKTEVVAMSLGPLQNVEQASKSALEMSYDLTPGVETGGATIDLTNPAEAAQSAGVGGNEAAGDEAGSESSEEGEGTKEPAGAHDTRVENTGPAVRPNFGTGLRIEPEIVSPGAEATLRMNHENTDVEGFGPSRAGHNLRLGGKAVDIAKEPAGTGEGAEYIELENHRLIALGKEEPYVEEDEEFVLAKNPGEADGKDVYVRLEDPAVLKVEGKDGSEEPYVKVVEGEGGARVVSQAQRVSLAGGSFEGHLWEREEHVPLKGRPLLRQAWHTDHIRFHVPNDAGSGVVTVECGQLAGAPLLQVSHTPTARLDVQVLPRSRRVLFDSSRSSDEDEGEEIKPRWKIDGVREGHGKRIRRTMAPRRALHTIELTVTDKAGHSDTVTLLMLRLPTPGFGVGIKDPRTKRAIAADRKAIAKAVAVERPKEIELDGYTDAPGRAARNLRRALAADAKVRKNLLAEPKHFPKGERAIAVAELAHGESCPIVPQSGRRLINRHVDLFVLNEDVIVKPAEGCHAESQQSARWHPPSTSKTLASTSSLPSPTASTSP
jgi:hypothetical protein